VILCSKVIFSYDFTYFSTVVKINFRSNTDRGKLAGNVKWHGKCKLRQRREHQAGLPSSTSPNTDLPSTKVHSEMPFVYNMDGDLPI